MNWENLRTCCLKGLKHGDTTCPVCGRKLVIEDYQIKPTTKGLKATLLIPFIALSLNSCERTEHFETGIVKDKLENKVFVTPEDDTTKVYRIIDFNLDMRRKAMQNLYLNIKKGDTLTWFNYKHKKYTITAMTHANLPKFNIQECNVIYVNGVKPRKLPNLLKQQKLDQQKKEMGLQQLKAQEEYNKARSR